MSNIQAICNSFKVDLLNGKHAFGTTVVRANTSPDVLKGALYLASANLSNLTTSYSSVNEVPNSGNYVAGGAVLTQTDPVTSGNTACWTPSTSISWSNVTFPTAFDSLLIYNATQNAAVAVYTFGAQTITAGNFTLTMPQNTSGNAIIQLA